MDPVHIQFYLFSLHLLAKVLLQVQVEFAWRRGWIIDLAHRSEGPLFPVRTRYSVANGIGLLCTKSSGSPLWARYRVCEGENKSRSSSLLKSPTFLGQRGKGKKKKFHLQMTNDQHRLLAKWSWLINLLPLKWLQGATEWACLYFTLARTWGNKF